MLPKTLPSQKPQWETPSFNNVDDPLRIINVLRNLDPIEYDQLRETQAKSLGIRVSTLDGQVGRYRPRDSDSDKSELVENLEPWDEPVEIAEILDNVKDLLRKHVILPDGAATALTLWIAGTYVYDLFRIWPKLTVTSPEKRCGKTTLLEVLSAVCNRPLVASNISPAAVYRVIEACTPTLLIDECDTFLKTNDELRGVINSGHTKSSAFVIRTTGDNHVPARFSTWCPMVIAMIKLPPDTILDRSVVIQLRRKLPGELVEKIPQVFFEQCEIIRRKFMRWSIDWSDSCKSIRPDMPTCANDRALDNWTSLFSIAESAKDEWRDKVKQSFELLTQSDDDDDAIGPMILRDIRTIFESKNQTKAFSVNLVTDLVNLEDRPWCEWKRGKPLTQNSLSRLLKPFKIKSQTIRIGTSTNKGYYKKSFQDAFHRYLPPEPPFQTVTPSQVSNHTGYSGNQNVTQKTSVTLSKSLQPTDDEGCDGVTVQNPYIGGKELFYGDNSEIY